MKYLILLSVCLTSANFACSNHPGISHEEWTSAVKDERNASGSVKTLSDDFFKSKGAVGTNSPNARENSRPIRTIKGN